MLERYVYDLVCIGSGPAGQRAAVQAAKLGKQVAVIERRRAIGGVCIETGTIPSKTFREAVRRFYSRPGLESDRSAARPTMDQLVSHVARVIEREIRTVESALERNDIEVVRGPAAFVDPNTLVVESEHGLRRLRADHILIAVGTTPGRPRGVDVDDETVVTSDTVLTIRSLPRTMAVVGAGAMSIRSTASPQRKITSFFRSW